MPDVNLDMEIRAPAATVWEAVLDSERYPDSMASVRRVRILEDEGDRRRTAWSVELKGSILEWEEQEQIDPAARTIAFQQLSGDLDVLDGRWTVEELAPELSRASLHMTFEIGIPLLAEMLNPVAKRSLADNTRDMLLGIERAAVEGKRRAA